MPSSPDISGKNIANPLAMILSISMMMDYSFSEEKISKLIFNAVNSILEKGYRTVDILDENSKKVSTDEMGDLVIEELNNE